MALKPTNASTAITTLLARYRSGLPTLTMVNIPSHLRLIFLNCIQRTEVMTYIKALTRHSQRSISDGKEEPMKPNGLLQTMPPIGTKGASIWSCIDLRPTL